MSRASDVVSMFEAADEFKGYYVIDGYLKDNERMVSQYLIKASSKVGAKDKYRNSGLADMYPGEHHIYKIWTLKDYIKDAGYEEEDARDNINWLNSSGKDVYCIQAGT